MRFEVFLHLSLTRKRYNTYPLKPPNPPLALSAHPFAAPNIPEGRRTYRASNPLKRLVATRVPFVLNRILYGVGEGSQVAAHHMCHILYMIKTHVMCVRRRIPFLWRQWTHLPIECSSPMPSLPPPGSKLCAWWFSSFLYILKQHIRVM